MFDLQEFLSEFKTAILLGIGLVIILIIISYIIVTPINAIICSRFGANTDLPVKFDLFSGVCYAQYMDIWLPSDQIYQLIGMR